MNERHDDLASAWLDGELSDAERRELAAGGPGDEVRLARDELEAVRDALAAPIDVPEGLADAQIARAVQAAELPGEAGGARVVAMRPRRRPGVDRLLVRAAGVVLVAGGLGVATAAVIGDSSGRDEDVLTASDAGGEAGGAERSATLGIAPSQEHAESDSGAAAPEAAPGPLSAAASELAASQDLDAPGLLAALEGLFGPAATWPAEPSPADSCSPGPPATGDGVPAAVVAFERDGVPLELVVPADTAPYLLERGTCRQVG